MGICASTPARAGKSGSLRRSRRGGGLCRAASLTKHDVHLADRPSSARSTQGGGGTVACYMANRNIDTVDAGVPGAVHARPDGDRSPSWTAYMTFKGMKVFYEEN